MIRRHLKKFFKILAGAVLAGQVGMLGAWPFDRKPQGNHVLHTTISADGQMIATLLNAGTNEQLLRVRKLDTDTKWRTVNAPPLTQSIRFASQGHELLLTYYLPQTKRDVLARLDLDKPGGEVQKVFEAEGLAFPVEVKPGQVMVRTHQPANPSSGKVYLMDHYWILVGPGQQVQKVGPDSILPYPAPNIVGSGFFWTEEQIGMNQEVRPLILSYPLPGGVAPDFSRERLEKNTWAVRCDQTAKRCLRRFISNLDQRPAVSFVYDVEVLFGSERCKLTGFSGSSDENSLTPDGNAAVMSLAPGHDKPRHVVVAHFDPKQCEPISVQHIDFEQK